MKRQIFSLILSAAIFTTSPLFAMEPPEHKCPTCATKAKAKVKYLLTDKQKAQGKGNFNVLSDDSVVSVISELPLKNVYSASLTSRAMYNLCQRPFVWASLANKEKENFIFPPIRCIKNCFQTASLNYFNLFKDKTPEVQVPASWLLSRKDTGLSHGGFSSPHELFSSAYHVFYLSCFEIGKNSFVLFSPRAKDLSILKGVDDKSLITFSWDSGNQHLCPHERDLFKSKGSVHNNDANADTDIENCFYIQRIGFFFQKQK